MNAMSPFYLLYFLGPGNQDKYIVPNRNVILLQTYIRTIIKTILLANPSWISEYFPKKDRFIVGLPITKAKDNHYASK